MTKSFYKLNLVLQSPLSIGSGVGVLTDNDIFKNSFNEPAIPASAIAGMLRTKFDNADTLFGSINGSEGKESKIITYDAEVTGNYNISVRDGVKLTEGKTSEKGAKYDFEVVEAGAEFVTYIETNDMSDSEHARFEDVLLSSNIFTMGKKGTRGYGEILISGISRKSFCLDEFDGYCKYLDFRLFSEDAFTATEELKFNNITDDDKIIIELHLLVNGSPMIRKYSTEPNESEIKAAPDFSQLTTKGDNKDIPIIPGTSWAGAFKAHMFKVGLEMGISRDTLDDMLTQAFGFISGNSSQKSKIVFNETQIVPVDDGSKLCEKKITRTAIDRFSGGSADKSLFTLRAFFGGKTVLRITVDKSVDDLFYSLLAATVKDLDMGIMSVGGQTSVGHGLFNVAEITVNGKKESFLSDNKINLTDAAAALKKGGNQ